MGGTGGFSELGIPLQVHNPSGAGSQMQFTGSATGATTVNRGFRVGYNGSGGQMWNFENNYLRFATSNNERLRIESLGQMIHYRGDNVQRYDLEFRQTGGISNGNYGGIRWSQNSTGGVSLAAIEIAYADSGRPDIVFKHRNRGGGSGLEEAMRIDRNGKIGINNSSPECRSGGIDMSSNVGTSGKSFTDLRGETVSYTHLRAHET